MLKNDLQKGSESLCRTTSGYLSTTKMAVVQNRNGKIAKCGTIDV